MRVPQIGLLGCLSGRLCAAAGHTNVVSKWLRTHGRSPTTQSKCPPLVLVTGECLYSAALLKSYHPSMEYEH